MSLTDTLTDATERVFHVNGYQLVAKEWNTGAAIKVIACHGWLDNAASFDRLAALLDCCHIIALDMPGHGLSDHKSPQASYNIWDDLLDILAVADELAWQGFSLLGHSRGAIMSLLLTAAMPERIKALIMLDAILPEPVDVADTARQLNAFLTGRSSLHKKRLPRYASIEDAVVARCRVAGMSEASARLIVSRGLEKVGHEYGWRNDPRLMTASAFKLTADHCQALIDALKAPALLLLAQQGLGSRPDLQQLVATASTLHCQQLPGSHHFHMEEEAAIIADRIRCFLADLALSE